MASPSKPYSLAIVGGGISGLVLAIALLEQGIKPTIYEAAQHFSEIGAGVALGPNAVRAMSMMSPKIEDAFNICKTHNLSPGMENTWFTIRIGDARKAGKDGFVKPGVKIGDAWFDVKFSKNENRGGVYRAHFLDELVKHVPDEIAHFGKKLVDVGEADNGDVILNFADGSTAQHTAVIGCDGIKSRTRAIVLGQGDPATKAVFSGKYAYRGLIPMDEAVELVGEEEAKNSQMYFGYHGHVLTFPVQKGKTMNVVAFASSEEWKDEKWVVTTSKQDMVDDFAEWGPTVKAIINAMQKPDIWALFYHPPARTYYKDRICLVGDAAHATTPHQGAGAGMCIEDAAILSAVLKEANDIEGLKKAFAAYDEVRRPRTQKNVVTSKEAGMLYDFELEGDDLDKIEENDRNRMYWIWDEDLDAEVEQARKLYFGEKSSKI
ncbi:mannitol 1-phosphate dehydrogenase [Lophiotrema nucula]|uniref:Mannitol 1-phosphate dehydrogenase n=1 Tax=Lophiotrema nucula TaxID=690887 RepID=A0A6A5YFA1_9PLEO|nr:mannitol 1-phosphate dehydrogenase [Lophiotrema nucula]